MNNRIKDGFKEKSKRNGFSSILQDWFSIPFLVRVVPLHNKTERLSLQRNLIICIILISLWLFNLIYNLTKEMELLFVSLK